MTNSASNGLCRVDRRSVLAVLAGVLIGMGLVLQWIEVLFTYFVAKNAWFFATLLSETWNMINLWLSAAPWRQDLHYWPLLLVVTGAAILFSYCGKNRAPMDRVEGDSAGC